MAAKNTCVTLRIGVDVTVPGPFVAVRIGRYTSVAHTYSAARRKARAKMTKFPLGNLLVSKEQMQKWIDNDFEYDDTGGLMSSCSGQAQRLESTKAIAKKLRAAGYLVVSSEL